MTSRSSTNALRAEYRLAADTFGRAEIEAAKAVLDSSQLTMGPNVAAFEREFADWIGAKHALLVNSGSSANLIAIDSMLRRSAGSAAWRAGDEVLVPALCWPTTLWPLAQLGLKPVLVDVDRESLAIDLEAAAAAVSPKTRGMFLIHVLGRAPDMARYVDFCSRHGIALVEDTCESLGAHHGATHAGLFGHVSTFSCYFSHHISTIEGGVVATNDDRLRDDLASLRAHGWARDRDDRDTWAARYPEIDPRFLFVLGGYNVRPTEISAAIGRVQLSRLDAMLASREMLALRVAELVRRAAPWLELIGADCLPEALAPLPRRERRHSWMTLPFRLREGVRISLADVKACLEQNGVETRPIIAGNIARHPATRMFDVRVGGPLTHSDELLARGFMIGCHPTATQASLETLETAVLALSDLDEGHTAQRLA